MHFYEKLIISIIVFIGVVIATAGIVGNYVKVVKTNDNGSKNSIILENVNI